ncbi:Zinc finger CCCH domain-containing protein 38 [Nymphaea thermarum]|nr:Zinc finger CCCH domain-containing protein 38 [Nymphaea thermarum]
MNFCKPLNLLEAGGDMPVDDSSRQAIRAENVVRKRASKWDLVSESSVRDETDKDKSNAETSNAYWNKESKSDWHASATVNASSNSWGEWKNDNTDRDGGDAVWSGDQSYATRMSPGLDAWRHRQGSRSPRSGWASSRRSRSRSPPRNFRHDIDDRKERGRREAQGSVPVCISYSKGQCRRGSECKYTHVNNDRDIAKHSNKNIATERNGHRQERGRYADNGTHSDSHDRHLKSRFPQDDNIRKRDTERERRPTFCRDFRAGRCFRESGCKYIHDDGVRSSDDFSVKEMVLERKHSGSEGQEVHEHLQEPKHETELRNDRGPPCRFFARGSCQKGSSCRYSHQVSTHETSGKRSRDEGRSRRVDDRHRSKGESYSEWGAKSEYDTHMSDWGQSSGAERVGDVKGNIELLGASCSDKEANLEPYNHHKAQEHEPHHVDDSKGDPKEDVKYQILPKEGLEASLHTNNQHKNGDPYGWRETAPSKAGLLRPDESSTSFQQQHGNTTLSTRSSDSQSGSTNMWNQIAVSASNAPISAFCWPVTGMSQQLPSQAPIAASMQVLLTQAEACQKLDTPKADSVSAPALVNNAMPALLQMTPSMITSQNSVANDRAVQMSSISASLAQIFETVQQIPQLYNSLNSVGSVALAPSQPFTNPNVIVPTEAAPSVHNQVQLSQSKPYDPITDSMEPFQQSENGQQKILEGSAPNLDKQQAGMKLNELYSIRESDKKDITQQNSAPEQKKGIQGDEACKDTQDQGKEKQSDNSTDAHGDTTNDEKKSKEANKEAKGMRMFKFALVEAVKEMLKPTWKEGRMSKEAHKSIVKKVVEKVTSTLQGPQIPNTQERIDQYLAFSKSKLTKLVQAYVEKYLKV